MFGLQKRLSRIVSGLVTIKLYNKTYNDLKTQLDLVEYKIDKIREDIIKSGFCNTNIYSFRLKDKNQIAEILKNNSKLYKSHSQYMEDLVIVDIFKKIGIQSPSYIDLGAHDPFFLSNTALLYENGSCGVNVEPNPVLYDKFVNSRGRDVNINVGVGSEAKELDYYVIKDHPALNTFSGDQLKRLKSCGNEVEKIIKIKLERLDSIIKDYCGGTFPDFLSIDVEGFDYDILCEIDYLNKYPKVICVEINFHGDGGRNIIIDQLLVGNGYFHYADVGGNSLYVRNVYLDQLS